MRYNGSTLGRGPGGAKQGDYYLYVSVSNASEASKGSNISIQRTKASWGGKKCILTG